MNKCECCVDVCSYFFIIDFDAFEKNLLEEILMCLPAAVYNLHIFMNWCAERASRAQGTTVIKI